MATSRGCPYACNWCAKPSFGRGYEQRSANSVAAELHLLTEAMRRGFAVRNHFLGDPGFVSVPSERMTGRWPSSSCLMTPGKSRSQLVSPGP